ncbi:hypothetical protein MN116_004142 [Schistosoma mekongi]|uniref:Serine hydroxymethyltransferase n=1 Tax=Schistosoma mekongi TaxID=38744 RepID=A0AAE1ZG55_SCHME|nr:hypothetical protein MN116_004142 [Schistosoma mekongi]
MDLSLAECDPEILALCKEEKERQRLGLELIASENFISKAVLQALSSSFHNKYSEGQVGARYYGGTEVVDKMESLCKKRALALFGLDESEWGVNVQAYSGSPANFAVYTGLVGPHGRIMGLDLPDGGHLTHGYQAASGRKVSATSLFFESVPYKVDPKTGWIDYERLEIVARSFRPKMIIAGTSAYSRHLDYPRFRQIADSISALLLADMSHIGGLVAAGLHPSPFKYADVVMTTTHKTIRGPRAAMIFFRKIARSKENGVQNGCPTDAAPTDFERRINEAVFPGLQGGPHNNTIAAMAVCLKEAASSEYRAYQEQVLKNMKQLCKSLIDYGYELVTGGSDTHLCLIDLRPLKIDGARAEKILELVRIAANKNTCPGDLSALRPGGLRFGSAALTSRSFREEDFIKVAEFIHTGIQIAVKANELAGSKLLKDYDVVVETNVEVRSMIGKLRCEIEEFASKYPLPGLDY